jgi:hypothetical protein
VNAPFADLPSSERSCARAKIEVAVLPPAVPASESVPAASP